MCSNIAETLVFCIIKAKSHKQQKLKDKREKVIITQKCRSLWWWEKVETRTQLEAHLKRGTYCICAEAGEHKEDTVKALQVPGLSFLSVKEINFQ